MHLAEIMNIHVETISENASAEEARNTMRLHGFHHLVVKRNGQLVGVVSDRDLGGTLDAVHLAGRAVAEVMTPNLVSASPKTTLREAANLLRGHIIGCLPVMDGQKLVGIVTITDVLDLLGRGSQTPRRPQYRRSDLQGRIRR